MSSRRDDTRDAMLIVMAKTIEAMATIKYKEVYNLGEAQEVRELVSLSGRLKGTREIFEQEVSKR